MNLLDNKLWLEDIDKVLASSLELSELEGRSVYITGATGLICSALIDVLIRYNETHKNQVLIYAAGRSFERVKTRFAAGINKGYVKFVSYDATSSLLSFGDKVDYIIHGASNASPDLYAKEPVETLVSNFDGLKSLLDMARKRDVKRVLFISSSEVYGNNSSDKPIKEDEYGFVDILNSRSSYPIGKRAAETLCVAYAREYNIQTVVARPGHIYGPTASEKDRRVSSAWAYDVAHGYDIIMKSDGSQMRSYCYCLDCAAAILKILLHGECATAYNISNPHSIISIKDMAEFLCRYANVKLVLEKPDIGDKKAFNPMLNSSLDSTKLQSLGWDGLFDAETGFSHTVSILRDILGSSNT